MNKVKELLIKVLDEGETTSVKDMKWPSLEIGKWLLISTAFLSPLLGCILGGTFMDVNSKEFNVLVIHGTFMIESQYILLPFSEIDTK